MNDEKILSQMEIFFLALADKTRLRLLNLMREGEICVCFLVDVLGESQPKVSRHLAYLRAAGIVEVRREGKRRHYKIIEPNDEFVARLLRDTLVWLDSQEKMQIEFQRLNETCFLPGERKVIHSKASNIFVKANMSRRQDRQLETFLL